MRDAKAILRTNGQNHKYNVENLELYTTPAIAVEKLLERETFSDSILEPACGIGSISDILINNGYNVISSDIVNRGYINQRYTEDFLSCNYHVDSRVDIITNPPYSLAEEFVRKSIDISTDGTKIAMLLKLTFLEGVKRRELFKKYPPKRVLVFSKRIRCNRGGGTSRQNNQQYVMRGSYGLKVSTEYHRYIGFRNREMLNGISFCFGYGNTKNKKCDLLL